MAIVDDNSAVREAYSLTLEIAEWTPVELGGPLKTVEDTVSRILGNVDAALCDLHLSQHNYARFNGAELAAMLYDQDLPSALCTSYAEASVDELRPHLAKLPALLDPHFGVAELDSAIEKCANELQGVFTRDRRPWRALVHFVDVDSTQCYVRVPAWDESEKIRLPRSFLPPALMQSARVDDRLYAWVNVGASRQQELYFIDWESQ